MEVIKFVLQTDVMGTFLFAWNPSKFSWRRPNHLNEYLDEDIRILRQGKPLVRRWSCGVIRNAIGCGDRVYLMMLGKQANGKPLLKKGIVGSGFVETAPYEASHYDPERKGQNALYIDIRFDQLLDPESQSILDLDKLERINSTHKFWTPQSAKNIDSVSSQLEKAWIEALSNIHAKY